MANYKLPIITGTSLSTGDLLRWDGSNWVNYADSNYAGGSDKLVGIDVDATPGYLGAAAGDGVLRTGAGIAYADGGDFITLSIADKALAIAKLADGTDGELITWNADGVIATVAVGTAGHVLTSGGVGVAPTFQVAAGAGANTALSNLAAVAINLTLVSDTDNTDALGTAAIGWSDLFLGNESVITWSTAPSTADITLTHTANTLTFAGGTIALGTATAANGLTIGDTAITDGVITDATGLSVAADTSFTSFISLITTVSSTTGVIRKGANSFIHDFSHPTGDTVVPDGRNFFAGISAGNFTMGSTATWPGHGSYNSSMGYNTLTSVTEGYANSAIGPSALNNTTTGFHNSAIGSEALFTNTIGYRNVAIGPQALYFNTEGYSNNAVGYRALYNNTIGDFNTAFGQQCMLSNTEGNQNLAFGSDALGGNLVGERNISIGGSSAYATTASNNIAIGYQALRFNITGSANITIGYQAGYRNLSSDRFIIDNRLRADVATEITNCILYGIMAASPGSQTLRINARLVAANIVSGTTQAAAGAAAGELWVDTDDGNTIKRGT